MRDHQRIYKKHYGPIPLDDEGRTYEIHHIDGDNANNDPKNLKAVSIQEHYDLHYGQGDWAACHRIAHRLGLSSQEISELGKKAAELAAQKVRGTIWIYKEGMGSQRIHPSDFEIYEKEGWTKGLGRSAWNKGLTNWTEQSERMKGKPKNVSTKVRKQRSKQLTNYNKNRVFDEDTLEKMRKAKSGTVSCYDSNGNYLRVSREEFNSRKDLVGISAKNKKKPFYDFIPGFDDIKN